MSRWRQHRWIRGDWQILLWLFPFVPGRPGVRRNRVPVIGRWKIIDQLGRLELYDLRTDPGELRDLAPSKPDALGRMRKALDERRARDHVTPFR